ncbi:MAG: capsid protein, partial [Ruminococcus sp.]|nr:capsid protein [Ruminococcus sp.]
EKIRKIHSGLPAIIVDTLAYIVGSDSDGVAIDCAEWEKISEEIYFEQLVGKAVCDTLVDGDRAFKISIDTDISAFPIVDFVGADKVRYDYRRGILNEVIFMTDYSIKSSVYRLEEHYGKGYIRSILYDSNGNETSLDSVPELADIPPVVNFDGDYIMAVPLKFYTSKKCQNRGKSIFDGGKSDCFDALDEVVSQWWDAIRAGRVQKYIPECMIPRNAADGSLKSVNSFGTDFIMIEQPISETVERPKIEVVQPDIKYEAFVNAYTNCLLMCLQGLVSPATLGIDVGKMQSADAQREKKDVTGNTRNTITSALENALPKLIEAILYTYDNMRKIPLRDCGKITVSFGEYA